MNPEEELSQALQAADVLIGFSPLADEQEFSSFLKKEHIEKSGMSVLAERDSDPHAFAASLLERFVGKRIVILIPGKEFDATGTRHGRGGGWYDKFLSTVPREWLRVGVLDASRLAVSKLMRETWDEPMDYLLQKTNIQWIVVKVGSGN